MTPQLGKYKCVLQRQQSNIIPPINNFPTQKVPTLALVLFITMWCNWQKSVILFAVSEKFSEMDLGIEKEESWLGYGHTIIPLVIFLFAIGISTVLWCTIFQNCLYWKLITSITNSIWFTSWNILRLFYST